MRPRVEDLQPLLGLESAVRGVIGALPVRTVGKGAVLFRPGDAPTGFIVVLSGHIAVYLIGRSGRGMLLYHVVAGQTCIQTTLCLIGGQPYNGEAVAEAETSFVVLPKAMFAELMDGSPTFRGFVFRAFGDRLRDVLSVLENVSFVSVNARLASEVLRRAGQGEAACATHQELAIAIGSAREVVSRRLEGLRKAGMVRLSRGRITVADRDGLSRLAAEGRVTSSQT